MKKYYLVMINLCLLFIENVLITVAAYINPTRQNILNISGTIIGILLACEITMILAIIKEKINKVEILKNRKER